MIGCDIELAPENDSFMSLEEMCITCRKTKIAYHCDLCHEPLCKKCTQMLAEDSFVFLAEIPEDLTHLHYCYPCYSAKVEPELEAYGQTMELARNVYFFFTTQKRPPPIIKKSKSKIKVADCMDRDETILRLGFQAASQGFNAVVEAEVVSVKVRNESYQKSVWSGIGYPAAVDGAKVDRWE
jgi:hypothetical protein